MFIAALPSRVRHESPREELKTRRSEGRSYAKKHDKTAQGINGIQ